MVEAMDQFGAVALFLARYLLILAVSYLLAAVIFPSLIRLVKEAGLVRPNFKGENIPASTGIIFLAVLPFSIFLGMILKIPAFNTINSFLFLFVAIGMGFMGFFDDQLGNHDVKGFRGHFRVLFREKRLTTGGFKAIFGAVIALVFSLGTLELTKNQWPIWTLISNFLLVALSANSINLSDLRPGRAGKFYLFGFILIVLFSRNSESHLGLFLPVLATLLYYLPYDLRAEVMMGDSGSNLLGASLGMMMAWMFSDMSKAIALILLLGLQLLAEKYSISAIIERTSWLKYLDELGRRRKA